MSTYLEQLKAPCAAIDTDAQNAAEARQMTLTKPPGSLGQLESVATRLSAHQGTVAPSLERVEICVFAADHGVAAEGVSAFPQAVTAEMVKNFARGGAAICVLARANNARLSIVNLGTVAPCGDWDNVISAEIAPQTQSFVAEKAMNTDQLEQAFKAGIKAAERAKAAGAQLFIGGDMGIANTTSATAIAAVLTGISVKDLVGPGTGLDASGVQHKRALIEKAIQHHALTVNSSVEDVLCAVGGFEIAALCAAYIRAAQLGISVFVDGFITSSAALCAHALNATVENWWFFSHGSAEPGHQAMLKHLEGTALVDLGMRLGEASGAAVALPLMRLACDLQNQMATFDEAGVSK